MTGNWWRFSAAKARYPLGVDLETIKSIVGHADLDMTRHYLHIQEPIRQAAVQKFNDAFTTESDEE